MADRVLVTGGSGMAGANLVRALIRRGSIVTVGSRHGSDRWRLAGITKNLSVVELNYADSDGVAACLESFGPNIVYHLASTPFNPSTIPAAAHFEANVSSSINLLDGIRRVGLDCRFIAAGSCAAYGEGAGLKEDAIPAPATLLGAAKQAARVVLETYARLYGLKTLNLCLFTPFGPWEAPNRLIPNIVNAALGGEPIRLTEGRQQRDFLMIDDVVDAFLTAGDADYPPGVTINICSGTPTSVRDLAHMLLKVLKMDTDLEFGALPTRPDEIMMISGDNGRAKELLDWRPKVAIEEGLERSVAWIIDHRHFYQ